MSRPTSSFLVVLFAVLTWSVSPGLAQGGAGSLDTTFGGDGSVTTAIGSSTSRVAALVVQADGKIVAAGSCSGATNGAFCLSRYNTDGTLDTTFGTGGKVTTPIGSGDAGARALVVQPDGKLVAAGGCATGASTANFCLARYTSTGVLDGSFGTGGVVSTLVGTVSFGAAALIIEPDGKLVVGGGCYDIPSDSEFCLVRYDANGAIDTTFGDGGSVIVEFDDEDDTVRALVRLPDGKFIAAGSCGVFGDPHAVFCLAGFDAGGVLDPTFGVVARVMTDISAESDRAAGLVRQADGKLVAAGACDIGSTFNSCLARYTAAGVLDGSFGTGGKVLIDATGINDHDAIQALVIQPDGKLVAAGFCDDPTYIGFCLARYDSSGNPDATFGVGGFARADINPGFDDDAHALALQPDGKLVAAGQCDVATSSEFCVARYNGDLSPLVRTFILMVTTATIPDSMAGPVFQTMALLTDMDSRNDMSACGSLRALINQINARQSRTLTEAQAAELRNAAQSLRNWLVCR